MSLIDTGFRGGLRRSDTKGTKITCIYRVRLESSLREVVGHGEQNGLRLNRVCQPARRAKEFTSEVVGVDEDRGGNGNDGVETKVGELDDYFFGYGDKNYQ